jgi:choline dehydrogenase-like flavoprotein
MPNAEETQVCIIGAGAAGGIVAYELASRGIEVVVLESGPKHDFSKRFDYSQRFLKGENPWASPLPELDRHTMSGDIKYDLEWRRARGVGGSTLHWEGYTPRFHENDFKMRTLFGVGTDWPISYDELEPYYGKAEVALGIAGSADDDRWAPRRSSPFPLPPFENSYSDKFFAKACGDLGISFSRYPQARNSVAYRDRSRCRACGTCHVCPTGAKASTDLTHIPRAEATGKTRVITNATVLKIDAEARKVRMVKWAGHDKEEHQLSAQIFVIAAGGVETPRLLLLSRGSAFPDGLANRSGLVGKNFMSQPVIDIWGRVKEQVYPYRVGFSSAWSRQYSVDRNRSIDGAFLLEFLNNVGPTPEWLALESGKAGADLVKHIRQEFGYTLGIRIYCEQLPDLSNSITLNPNVRDYFGNPVPHIHYSYGEYERKVMADATKVGSDILKQLGATNIRAARYSIAAHQIGTIRMGIDPQTSVVDANLRAHDLDNLYLMGSGCFPTASCLHPTLTISALAIRAAERIASQLAAPI